MIKKHLGKTTETTQLSLKRAKEFRKEFRKQSITAILAAFGFLIALSWKDFITELVSKIIESIGVPEQQYFYNFLVAVLVTLIAILGITIASKLQIKGEESKKQ